jgi:hypothetical protein
MNIYFKKNGLKRKVSTHTSRLALGFAESVEAIEEAYGGEKSDED